jgi:hypothetical protein
MHESIDATFTAGAIVGAVLVTAILVVPLARYVVLIAATCAIVGIYFTGGIPALVADISDVQAVIFSEPAFSAGTIAGVLVVSLISLGIRRTRIAVDLRDEIDLR